MSEETAPQSNEPAVADAQSLDDVINSFDVQVASQPEPQKTPVQEFTPAQSQHIDPYDESSLNKFAGDVHNQTAALQQEIQNLRADADARSQAEAQKVIDADIKSAVKVITKGIDGLDPLSAEILLEKTARENEGFNKIWQNRDTNPKAYEAALRAIVNDNESKFTRVDEQIAENHRAAQQSTQSNNTPAQSSETPMEAALAKAAADGNLDYVWAKMRDGG